MGGKPIKPSREEIELEVRSSLIVAWMNASISVGARLVLSQCPWIVLAMVLTGSLTMSSSPRDGVSLSSSFEKNSLKKEVNPSVRWKQPICFEADNHVLNHWGKWMSFVTTFCYHSVDLEGHELPSHLHEQESEGEEARDVESFWPLCRFLTLTTHR